MGYSTRDRTERIVIGTLLNDSADDSFFMRNRMALRKELFKDRRNAFVFGMMESMHEDDIEQTMPYDILCYCERNGIQYGNVCNFVSYLTDLSFNYAFIGFRRYVRELVDYYVRERKYGNA